MCVWSCKLVDGGYIFFHNVTLFLSSATGPHPNIHMNSHMHTHTKLKLVSHSATILEKRKLRAGEYLTDPHILRRHCENVLFLCHYRCTRIHTHTYISRLTATHAHTHSLYFPMKYSDPVQPSPFMQRLMSLSIAGGHHKCSERTVNEIQSV